MTKPFSAFVRSTTASSSFLNNRSGFSSHQRRREGDEQLHGVTGAGAVPRRRRVPCRLHLVATDEQPIARDDLSLLRAGRSGRPIASVQSKAEAPGGPHQRGVVGRDRRVFEHEVVGAGIPRRRFFRATVREVLRTGSVTRMNAIAAPEAGRAGSIASAAVPVGCTDAWRQKEPRTWTGGSSSAVLDVARARAGPSTRRQWMLASTAEVSQVPQ